MLVMIVLSVNANGAVAQSRGDREAIGRYIEFLTRFSTLKTLHCTGQARSKVDVPPGYGLSPDDVSSDEWSEQSEEYDFELFMTPDKYREIGVATTRQGSTTSRTERRRSIDGHRYITVQRTFKAAANRNQQPSWYTTIDCEIKENYYMAAPDSTRHGVPIRAAFYNTFDFLNVEPSLRLAIRSPDVSLARSEFEGTDCIKLSWKPPVRNGPAIFETFYFSLPPDVRLIAARREIQESSVRICKLQWKRNGTGQPALASAIVTVGSIAPDGSVNFGLSATRVDFDKFEFIDGPADFKWQVAIPPDAEIRDMCEESPIPTTMEVVEQEQKAERQWWLLVLGIVLVAGGLVIGLVVRRWRRR